MSDNIDKTVPVEAEEKFGGPVFEPRLYIQRYYYVQQVLIKHRVTSVVDFGSAECKISKFLVRIPTVERVALVDLDRKLLEGSQYIIRPQASDYLTRRECPLAVKIFHGSVTDFDKTVAGFEAVSMVEIIEHLQPNTLTGACDMVFGKLQPRIVVITTPNADFNVLFPGMTGFRHYDHKFEWSRQEFQEWCNSITERFPYTVEFEGIGDPPGDSQHLGHCSQAAVFVRRTDSLVTDSNAAETYRLVAESVYPHKEASGMSADEETLIELQYLMRQHSRSPRQAAHSDTESGQNVCIPVSTAFGQYDQGNKPRDCQTKICGCFSHCDTDRCKMKDMENRICFSNQQECSYCGEKNGDFDKTESHIIKSVPDCRDCCGHATNIDRQVHEHPQHIDGICAGSYTEKQIDSLEDSGLRVYSDEDEDFVLIRLSDLLKYRSICTKFTIDHLRTFLMKHGYTMTEDQSCVVLPMEYEDRYSDYNKSFEQEADEESCIDESKTISYTSNSTQLADIEPFCSEESWD